ncbi:MAG: lipopolysaccharide assembly protein LapB, partial [Enterovibrio sp.]
ELELKKGEYKSAAHHLEAVLEQDPDFIPEVLAPLELCYQKLHKEGQLQPFLTHCLEKGAGASVELRMADLIWQSQNEAMAQTFLSRQLSKNPTMRGFHKLMELHVAQAEEGRAKTSLTMLKELVEAQIKVKPQYCCRKCGFSSRSLYWQCPSCKSWGAVKPIKGLDGE